MSINNFWAVIKYFIWPFIIAAVLTLLLYVAQDYYESPLFAIILTPILFFKNIIWVWCQGYRRFLLEYVSIMCATIFVACILIIRAIWGDASYQDVILDVLLATFVSLGMYGSMGVFLFLNRFEKMNRILFENSLRNFLIRFILTICIAGLIIASFIPIIMSTWIFGYGHGGSS